MKDLYVSGVRDSPMTMISRFGLALRMFCASRSAASSAAVVINTTAMETEHVGFRVFVRSSRTLLGACLLLSLSCCELISLCLCLCLSLYLSVSLCLCLSLLSHSTQHGLARLFSRLVQLKSQQNPASISQAVSNLSPSDCMITIYSTFVAPDESLSCPIEYSPTLLDCCLIPQSSEPQAHSTRPRPSSPMSRTFCLSPRFGLSCSLRATLRASDT